MGGARSWHRHGDRKTSTTTARHLHVSPRSASAATSFAASGDTAADRGTVAHLVDRWVAGKIDVSNKTRGQYRWAAGHIRAGLGGIPADHLERDNIARWLEGLAAEGRLSRRSIQIIRMVLRATFDEALTRPAGVMLPKQPGPTRCSWQSFTFSAESGRARSARRAAMARHPGSTDPGR
jgi:hypothetical protein